MLLRDFHNTIEVKPGFARQETGNTAFVSAIIDRAGYEGVEFIVGIGTLADADATFTALLEDGDAANLSDNAAVADAYRVGALPSFQYDDDNKAKKVGYVGPKRYVRLTITPANNSGAADVACLAVLFNSRKLPTP